MRRRRVELAWHILPGEDGNDAGDGKRLVAADALDAGMRMRRAQHFEVQRALHRHVEGVAGLTGDDRLGERVAQALAAGIAPTVLLLDIDDAMERVVDAVIAGAAAEIALQHARQVLMCLLVEGCGCHDHARRAEPALKGLRIEKGLLHRVQSAVACQPLDGRDLLPCGAEGGHQARMERLAVDMDRAGAAIALVAALLDAEKSEAAQEGAQALAGSRFRRDQLPVDGAIHVTAPCRSSARICSA